MQRTMTFMPGRGRNSRTTLHEATVRGGSARALADAGPRRHLNRWRCTPGAWLRPAAAVLATLLAAAPVKAQEAEDENKRCHYEPRDIGGGVIATVRVCFRTGTEAESVEVEGLGPARLESLAGITGFELVIDLLPAEFLDLKLDRQVLYDELEERLTARGVPIVKRASALEGSPRLMVRLVPSQSRIGLAYSVDLMLFQRVALARAPEDRRVASTWQVSELGFSQPPAGYEVRSSLRRVADRFATHVAAARAAPPKPDPEE